MPILERHVHTVHDFDAFWERERKFKAAEDRIGGFPEKHYFSLISGADATGTLVHEREWASFTAAEAAYNKLFAEPGIDALGASGPEIGNTERTEYYFVEVSH